jgi:hypothetical protein
LLVAAIGNPPLFNLYTYANKACHVKFLWGRDTLSLTSRQKKGIWFAPAVLLSCFLSSLFASRLGGYPAVLPVSPCQCQDHFAMFSTLLIYSLASNKTGLPATYSGLPALPRKKLIRHDYPEKDRFITQIYL